MTQARQRRQLLIAVLAFTLVVLGVLARQASTDQYAPDGEDSARGERAAVVARAKTLAAQAMSYDASSAPTDVAKVEQSMRLRRSRWAGLVLTGNLPLGETRSII